MKRAVSVILSVFQLVLLSCGGALLWLDKKFMGVMRYIANKNRVWSQAAWAEWLPIAVTVFAVVVLVWGVVMLKRHCKKFAIGFKLSFALLALSCGFTVIFVCFADIAMIRSYYFLSAVLITVSLFQLSKCLLKIRK